MDTRDFSKDVVERSYQIPVLVDFWAPWCGPCRILSPTIEQLAAEQEGRWELVKLNTEDFPEIAQQYRVMSIPNVKLFRDGKPVAEFVGALPRKDIEKWLKQHIPSGEKMQLSAIVEKARSLVFSDPLQAIDLVKDIALGDEHYDSAEDIRAIAHFLNHPLEEESGVARAMRKARESLATGPTGQGLEAVIEATTLDKSYQNDLPRKTAIALFHLLGDAHPLTKQYRWRFDMALY